MVSFIEVEMEIRTWRWKARAFENQRVSFADGTYVLMH